MSAISLSGAKPFLRNVLDVQTFVIDVQNPNANQSPLAVGTGTRILYGPSSEYLVYDITRESPQYECTLSKVLRTEIYCVPSHTDNPGQTALFYFSKTAGPKPLIVTSGFMREIRNNVDFNDPSVNGNDNVCSSYFHFGDWRFFRIYHTADFSAQWVVRFHGIA